MRKRNWVFWVWEMTRLGKVMRPSLVLGEFAAKDGADVLGEARAVDEGLEAAGNDVVLDADAVGLVLGGEEAGA